MFSLLVPLLSLATILGPEIPLGSSTITSAPNTQSVLSVASNGHDFLALWGDRRNTLDPNVYPLYPALYSGRIDPSGLPVNPTGHKLFDAATGRLTWTGTSYLLVYTLLDGRSFMQPLDDDGSLTGNPKQLALDGPPVAIASSRQNVLLISSTRANYGFSVSLLSDDGIIIRTTPMEMDRVPHQPFVFPDGDYGFIGIHSNGCGGFACTHTVFLSVVDPMNGSIRDTPLFDVTIYADVAAAVSDDGRILIVVQQDAQTPPSRIVSYEMIRSDGSIVAPMTVLETKTPIDGISGSATPSVGWDGSQFLVLAEWPDPDVRRISLHAFRVTSSGVTLDATPLPLNETVYSYFNPPQFASSSAGRLLVWDRDTDVFARVAKTFDDLPNASSHDLTFAPPVQAFPKLATGGLAVWVEGEAVHGAVIGMTDREVLKQPTSTLTPAATARGTSSYLVVWRTVWPLQVVGRRMALDGTPLADPFVIASQKGANLSMPAGSDDLSVAWNGSFLVSWVGDNNEVYAARVSESGVVLDSQPLKLSTAAFSTDISATPRIVSTVSGFLVVWLQQRYCGCLISPQPPPISTLYAARLSDGGAGTNLGAVWQGNAADELVLIRLPNKQAAAIWRYLAGTDQKCIDRMLLNDDGMVVSDLSPIVCRTASLYSLPMGAFDAAWDGSKLVLAWNDRSSETIVAERFDPFTMSSFDEPLQVNPLGTKAIAPSVVAKANGVTIAYQRLEDVSRVFVRDLQTASPPRRRATR